MTSRETTEKVATDAGRLLESDGPHLRKWMRDAPDDFIRAVHAVAASALAQRQEEPEPRSGGYLPRRSNKRKV